jgi:TRAP-type transport system periplasmic protein
MSARRGGEARHRSPVQAPWAVSGLRRLRRHGLVVVVGAALLSAVVTGCGTGQAGSGSAASRGKTYQLTIGTCCAANSSVGSAVQKWADLIAKYSKGRVKAIPHFGDLGTDLDVAKGVGLGTIDLGITSTAGQANTVPGFGVLELPYIFSDYNAAYRFMDGPSGQGLLKDLESHGIIGFGYSDLGWRNFADNKHPITGPADLSGLKVRSVESPVSVATWKSVGATPIPLGPTEMYLGLRQGTIDGLDMPAAYMVSGKLYEVAKYYSVSDHSLTPIVLVGNKAKLGALPPDLQAAVRRAATDAIAWHRGFDRKVEADGIAQLKQHMKINVLTQAERDALKAKFLPVYAVAKTQMPPQLVDSALSASGR